MAKHRKTHNSLVKARVAIAAIREQKTVSQLASQHGVHATQIHQWKRRLLDGAPELFESGRAVRCEEEYQRHEAELLEKVGRLTMEVEWLKKNLPESISARRRLVNAQDAHLSIRRQCELLGLSRSTYYHEPASESEENLRLMRIMDEQYLKHPEFERRMMTDWLSLQGLVVNEKRARRLMGIMGIEAIYRKPRTTLANKQHRNYPYLLRGLDIIRPNQVWSTDITYIPMAGGFMYLVAIMDWYKPICDRLAAVQYARRNLLLRDVGRVITHGHT